MCVDCHAPRITIRTRMGRRTSYSCLCTAHIGTAALLLQASHMLTQLMPATQWRVEFVSTCKDRPQPGFRHRHGTHVFADDGLLIQLCMLPADLQAAAPEQAQAQVSAAPGGAGRPPTPGSQPGMWPGAQPAAVAVFPGTAAHQPGSKSMAAHQPSSPAHLRMPQGMAVQQPSSHALQTAYMQQPRPVPVGHLHQQQAQTGGHQGPMQGLLHDSMLLPGHSTPEVGDSMRKGGSSPGCLGCLPLSVFVVLEALLQQQGRPDWLAFL